MRRGLVLPRKASAPSSATAEEPVASPGATDDLTSPVSQDADSDSDGGGGADDGGGDDGALLGEAVCAVCETGGTLDTCDGCVRSWHGECLSLSALPGGEYIAPGSSRPPDDPDAPWLCDECELRVHRFVVFLRHDRGATHGTEQFLFFKLSTVLAPRCFLCKAYARDEGLWRCAAGDCAKYYHKSCLRKWTGLLGSACADTVVSPDLCPRHHYCGRGGACGGASVSSSGTPGSPDKSGAALGWRCLRCPTAYHDGCRPGDVHTVDFGSQLFTCLRHVLDATGSPPPLESYALLAGRRRLKLASSCPTLDSFLEKRAEKAGPRLRKNADKADKADKGGKAAGSGGSGGGAGAEDADPAAAEAGSPSILRKAIPKKEPRAARGGDDGQLSPAVAVVAAADGFSKLKGTRMKIKGYDPNRAAKAVDLMRVESAQDRRRRMGLSGGIAVGGGVAKGGAGSRGTAARLGLMAWVAAQMKGFDGDGSRGGAGSGGGGGSGGNDDDDDAADRADPSLLVPSGVTAAPVVATASVPKVAASPGAGDAAAVAAAGKRRTEATTATSAAGAGAGAAAAINGVPPEVAEAAEAAAKKSRHGKEDEKDKGKLLTSGGGGGGGGGDEDSDEDFACPTPAGEGAVRVAPKTDNDDDEEEEEEDEPLEEVLSGSTAATAAAATARAHRPFQPIPLCVVGDVVVFGRGGETPEKVARLAAAAVGLPPEAVAAFRSDSGFNGGGVGGDGVGGGGGVGGGWFRGVDGGGGGGGYGQEPFGGYAKSHAVIAQQQHSQQQHSQQQLHHQQPHQHQPPYQQHQHQHQQQYYKHHQHHQHQHPASAAGFTQHTPHPGHLGHPTSAYGGGSGSVSGSFTD